MSKDSQYHHALWHIESSSLAVEYAPLELLVDFSPPELFTQSPAYGTVSASSLVGKDLMMEDWNASTPPEEGVDKQFKQILALYD